MVPSFSVVMTVYDNARELEQNLPAYLGQDYGQGFEVIVVDESSTDDTADVLMRFKTSSGAEGVEGAPRLYSTFLPRPNRQVSRQRMALTLGVKAAKKEWVVFADINKVPDSKWLSELAEFTTDDTAMMLGYIRKNGDIRLQLFSDINAANTIVGKAERRKSNGHKGRLLRRLRGKYDFCVVRTSKGHDLLKLYEQDIRGSRLFGYRLRTMAYNLFH